MSGNEQQDFEMTKLSLAGLLDQVEQIAFRAGDAIMEVYGRTFDVEEKADQSPLTEADMAANTVIVAALNALPGEIPVLSEEAVEAFPGPDANGRYWLVDPLDGTKEFIKRNGEFTVNIALIEQGRPVLGVVFAPALGRVYLGAEGLGAFRVEGRGGARQAIRVAARHGDQPWRVVGSRSHFSAETSRWLEPLGGYELVAMGSSLKFCLVAEGAADLYPRLGPTCLWDTGAAHAVVNAAGGSVVTLEGVPLDYSSPDRVMNPWFVVYASRPEQLHG